MEIFFGYIIDLIVGDPRNIFHPIVLIGKFISWCEKYIRKMFGSGKAREIISGFITVIVVVVLSGAVPFAILFGAYKLSFGVFVGIEVIMCWQIIAAKSLKVESMKVYKALISGDINQARYNVSMIVGRDTNVLDDIGITKAAVETVAENTSDGVIAPLIYMCIGGPVLGFVYKAVNTMDSMIGYKNEKYLYYGRCAARLDDILNFIPSRISALIMVVASKFTGLNAANAYKIWRRDGRKHASPNSAQTEAACAGALDIKLAGDAIYGGIVHKKEYIGDENRAIEYEDILRANKLMYATTFIGVVICSAIRIGVYFICL